MSWLSVFDALVSRRLVWAVLVAGLCTGAVFGAQRLVIDPSPERMHPVADPVKGTFERYRVMFPFEDSLAVLLVEGPKLFTPEGFAALETLERGLEGMPHVRYVVGPATARMGDTPVIAPEVRQDAASIRRAIEFLRTQPLARGFVHPTRDLLVVRIGLDTRENRVASETAFTDAAQGLLAANRVEGLTYTLSGAPVVRATMGRMLQEDMALLLPLALIAILLLVALAWRDAWAVFATAATLGAAWLWMLGVLGWAGLPIGLLTSFAPLVVLIVALTDTVHVLTGLAERRLEGRSELRAIAEAMAASAGPCLATELVIAGGFGSMAFTGLRAVIEFGVACAAGVLLAWLANMLVLPLVLALRPPFLPARVRTTAATHDGLLDRLLARVERRVLAHPGRILLVTALIAVASVVSMRHLRTSFRVVDDLRADTPLAQQIRYVEEAIGGFVPVAVMIERPDEGSVLAADALGFQQRIADVAAALPEKPPVIALPPLVQAGRDAGLAGAELLAQSEEKANVRIVKMLRQQHLLDDVLTDDRRVAAVVAMLPNVDGARMAAILKTLDTVAHEGPPSIQATVTGNLAMTAHVTSLLTTGLVESFLGALLVSFLAFFLVLRSVRLALIGLIPNVFPVAVLFGAMPLLGVDLKPSTVIIASMALVIADDDTLQFLVRFKRRFRECVVAGDATPHRTAALGTLRECGRAMAVSSVAVSGGFLLLLLSRFDGIAHLGLLTGLTLCVAGLADVFLGPVLLVVLRPKLAVPLPPEPVRNPA